MKYSEALKFSIKGTLRAIVDPSPWIDAAKGLGELLFGITVILIRLLIFISFPVSIPLIALILRQGKNKKQKSIREQMEDDRK